MPGCDYIWNTTVTLQEILDTHEDSSVGLFAEVDLKYTQHLHDIHNAFPLAPEKNWKKSVPQEELCLPL